MPAKRSIAASSSFDGSGGCRLPFDFDFHAPHWHGETVVSNGMRTDTLLGPMGMLIADMIPDNPGTWLYHCHLNIHLRAGMELARVTHPPPTRARAKPLVQQRTPRGAFVISRDCFFAHRAAKILAVAR
jgi:hypothetical protein